MDDVASGAVVTVVGSDSVGTVVVASVVVVGLVVVLGSAFLVARTNLNDVANIPKVVAVHDVL